MRRAARVVAGATVVVAAAGACDRTPLPTATERPKIDAESHALIDAFSGTVFTLREDLGTLGGSASEATDINNGNQVTGTSEVGSQPRAFMWTPQGGMIDINAVGATTAMFGRAINDAGQILAEGRSTLRNGVIALRASPPYPTTALDLGKLGVIDSYVGGINDIGSAVGSSENPGLHPFLWISPGPMQDIGTLTGSNGFGYANGINNATTVVGGSYDAGGNFRAFRWTSDAGMVNLGTLGGDQSDARAINQLGDIVGWAETSPGIQHAARWPAGGGSAIDLGVLSGRSASRANAINDVGVIAGWSANSSSDTVAVLWLPNGVTKALDPLPGGKISVAAGINNMGHVAGRSDLANGDQHAVVWWNYRLGSMVRCVALHVPSPLPEAVAILVSGLSIDVNSVEPKLFTLGDGKGNDAALLKQNGAPVYEIRNTHDDSHPDLVLFFDRGELVSRGLLTPNLDRLLLLDTTSDRGHGVLAVVVM